MDMKKINILLFVLAGFLFYSCNNMLDIKPEDVKDENDAFQGPKDVQASLNAAYQSNLGAFGGAFQRYSELMGDNAEPIPVTDKRQNIYNRTTTGYFTADDFYSKAYVVIFRANLTLEKLSLVDLPEKDVRRITAECKFLRALCNFYLVRMFAQPYGYTSDNSHYGIGLKTNTQIGMVPRATVAEVYGAIEEDLKSVDALPSREEEMDIAYASSWAVKSLLAEVAFSKGDYDKAFEYANDVIEQGPFSFDTTPNDKWLLGGSAETIFNLASNEGAYNAGGDFGDFRSEGSKNPNIRISRSLYNKANTLNDSRNKWYKTGDAGMSTEYVAFTKFNYDWMDVPLFHLTEMMFVRAESAVLKTNQDLATAIADVNRIKTRAYGSESFNLDPQANADAVLNAIREEKRLELAGEGFRVYDLKRIGAHEAPQTEIRGVPWDYVGLALQFPLSEHSVNFPLNPEAGM